jgi:hypothetical protein
MNLVYVIAYMPSSAHPTKPISGFVEILLEKLALILYAYSHFEAKLGSL